jgi:hypothetical protein
MATARSKSGRSSVRVLACRRMAGMEGEQTERRRTTVRRERFKCYAGENVFAETETLLPL